MGTHRGVRLAVVVLALLSPAGCGALEATVKPEYAAQAVVDFVTRQTGYRPTDVTCPSDVYVAADAEFDCYYTGPDGEPYTARLKIMNKGRDAAGFAIDTRRS